MEFWGLIYILVKALKIVFVSELVYGGGAETFLRNLITGLCRYEPHVEIIIVTAQQADTSALPSCVTRLYTLPRDRLWFQSRIVGLSNVFIERRLNKILSTEKPDVIHINNVAGFGLSVLKAVYEDNYPAVYTLHDHWTICPNTLLFNTKQQRLCDNNTQCLKTSCIHVARNLPWLDRILEKRFETVQLELIPEYLRHLKVVAVSKYLAEVFKKFTGIGAEIIYNGLEFEEGDIDENLWNQRRGVSYLGGKRIEKGYNIIKELVKCIASLNKGYDITLYIRGDMQDFAPYAGPINAVIRSYFENVEDVYRNSFLVLIPSIWPEPLPYTAIEALVHGSLVLAFNIGGLPEVIEDDRLLVQYGDVEEYIKRVLYIVKHKKEYFDVAVSHARRVREKFSLRKMVKRYAELYERVVR
jgi:glycosyltransferase involved in cell wall biosynthesis